MHSGRGFAGNNQLFACCISQRTSEKLLGSYIKDSRELFSTVTSTFHVHKRQKMCESALKFLQKCRSSGFMMPSFLNIDFEKQQVISKKTRSLCRRPGIFCDLQDELQKIKKKSIGHCTTNPLLYAFCRVLTKHSHCSATDIISSLKNDAEIQCNFALIKMKSGGSKCRFALVKNLCRNTGKCFALLTLFCAYIGNFNSQYNKWLSELRLCMM